MDMVRIWAIVFGIWAADLPAVELPAQSKQVVLPAGAADKWDAIGTYALKEESAATTLKLYYADSDSIADKAKRKGDLERRHYPNSFTIHAVYRVGDGPWKYKELFSAARVGFWKVTEVKPETITIQVRSKLILMSNSPIRFTDEEIGRIYKPAAMRLTLKEGTPVLK